MVLAADQDDHPLADVGVSEVPVQPELVGDIGELIAELVGAEGQALGQDLDALEELAGGQVPVLGRLHHPSPAGGDESGDRGHDARPIGAGDGQDQAAHPPIMAGPDPTPGHA